MRFLIVISLISPILVLFSCQSENQFDVLIGEWKSERNEGILTETWVKQSRDKYFGTSILRIDGDSVWGETIKLERIDENWFYNVSVPSQHEEPVSFKITEFNESSFQAENPQNDFPSVINYDMTKTDSLTAYISGEGKDTVYFHFKKVD